MRTSLFIMVIVLHAVCEASIAPGREICEVFPKNQLVKHGSDVVVFFRAPVNSDCHNKTGFDPEKLSWNLNNRRIPQDYYNKTDDSTFSVSIPHFSLKSGTVEFSMDEKVLSGTLIRTYSAPQNISCIGKMNSESRDSLTCTWDHDQYTTDTSYILNIRGVKETCLSKDKSCKMGITCPKLCKNMAVTVIAKTPAVEARSDEVVYPSFYETVLLDPPEEIRVERKVNDLRVTWESESSRPVSCQVRFISQGFKAVIKTVNNSVETTVELAELKECTSYSISVRCRYTLWSEWSQNVTYLTYLNVRNVQFHLWRSRSVASVNDGKEKRRVHLMWKGIPPSCEAFDEYRLFDQTRNISFKRYHPNENHSFIYLDENMHRITVAAFRNNSSLGEASMEIPSAEEDLILPSVTNVRMISGGGQINITWDKPNLTVSGYIIIWNSTEENHMWSRTEETYFYFKGENFTLYTISLTPLYKTGLGDEVRLHGYAQEEAPAEVLYHRAENIGDRTAEIHWQPVSPTQCCAFVVSYTVLYRAQHELRFRNVSVDKNQHSVLLEDLKPSTTYEVYVRANAAASYSESRQYTFSTKLYGEDSLPGLIMCALALILLPVFTVFFITLRKKYLSENFPNPRFSSISEWSSEKCKHPWSQLDMPWDSDSEKILICRVEAEDGDVGKLTGRIADHDFTTQETTMTTTKPEKENAAPLRPNPVELVSRSKEERRWPLRPVDLQIKPRNPPTFLNPSPYRHQSPVTSPLTSPVDSPKRVFPGTLKPRSSETETLLKPKPQKPTLPITYVTVDMFEQVKRSGK